MNDSFSSSRILLDPQALKFNYDFLEDEMGKDVLISCVVKGNAYGHGIESFVPMAKACGAKHFSVFSADEARRVKNSLNEKMPIMIMGYIEPSELEWAIKSEVEFFVFDMRRLESALDIAADTREKALIHIEFETGMNRTGFSEKELRKEVIPLLKQRKSNYILKGVCTHFAGSESIANFYRIQQQKNRFLKYRKFFFEEGLHPEHTHTCCSAAAIRYQKMRFDMVRIGILQYGFWPSPEIKFEYMHRNKLHEFNLHRVLTWKSRLMNIKKVKMGEYIGYGNSYQASRDMVIGNVPVGYSNGYSRVLSNSGRVLIDNVRSGVLGNVNMSSLSVDLGQSPNAKAGDEVILIGEQEGKEISVASFGELSNQLNYELLSRIPESIPRIVLEKM